MQEKRLDYIDFAKGIAICLVIIGHVLVNFGKSTVERNVNIVIDTFHMPLFFILSGYTFRSFDIKFSTFVRKKAKSLLIPLAEFSFITVILFHGIENIVRGTLKDYIDMFLVRKTLIGTVMFSSDSFFTPYWFLWVMFTAQCIFLVIIQITNLIKINEKYIELIRIPIMMVCILTNKFCMVKGIQLPLGAREALLAVPFIYIGHIINYYFSKRKNVVIIIICAIIFACGALYNCKNIVFVKMYISQVSNIIRFYITSIAGSVLVVAISKLLCKRSDSLLVKLGRNSLFLYGYHYIFIDILKIIRDYFHIEINNVNIRLISDICISSIVLAIAYGLSVVRKKVKIK